MEPATIIVTALALGAATGLKSVSEKAVKDSYLFFWLKTLTSRDGMKAEKPISTN